MLYHTSFQSQEATLTNKWANFCPFLFFLNYVTTNLHITRGRTGVKWSLFIFNAISSHEIMISNLPAISPMWFAFPALMYPYVSRLQVFSFRLKGVAAAIQSAFGTDFQYLLRKSMNDPSPVTLQRSFTSYFSNVTWPGHSNLSDWTSCRENKS